MRSPVWITPRLLLLLCALSTGLFQTLYPVDVGFGRGYEMAAVAKNLFEHGSFANPWAPLVTGPTAVEPPLYPLFLAALIKIFGLSPLVVISSTIANVLANATVTIALTRLSDVLFGAATPGYFASGLWILAMPLTPQWDVSFTVAGLLFFCMLTAGNFARREHVGVAPLADGIAAGLLLLLKPEAILVMGLWFIFLFRFRQAPLGYTLRYLSRMGIVAALCLAPWIVRNYLTFDALVLRTSLGITTYVSNNDCAEVDNFQTLTKGCYALYHPSYNDSEARLLKNLGEVKYDRDKVFATVDWIQSHPERFAQLTFGRMVKFWFPVLSTRTSYAIWVITFLSIPGMVMLARNNWSVTLFILSVWILYPLVYYIVIAGDRYRYPILWTSLLAAGYFLTAVLNRWFSAEVPASLPSTPQAG